MRLPNRGWLGNLNPWILIKRALLLDDIYWLYKIKREQWKIKEDIKAETIYGIISAVYVAGMYTLTYLFAQNNVCFFNYPNDWNFAAAMPGVISWGYFTGIIAGKIIGDSSIDEDILYYYLFPGFPALGEIPGAIIGILTGYFGAAVIGLLIILLIYFYERNSYKIVIRREEDRQKIKQHEEWRQTVPGLFDTAQSLTVEGNNLFSKGEFSSALANNQEALSKFEKAREGALGIGDSDLADTIGKNLKTCQNNIDSCNIALDKEKVESLYKKSKILLVQASNERKRGEFFQARETLKIANQKADDAFAISNRRCFEVANRDLTLILEQIRDEFNAIDSAMTSGVTGMEYKDRPVLSTAGDNMGIEINTGSEDFRGYIRFRVSIFNNRPSIIANVVVKLVVDEKFLYISHVEPEFPLRYNEVTLGNFNSNERKTVAFYLDPQMCSTSNVYAHVTYMDSKGRFGSDTSIMKQIGGKCPIFFTREEANTAKLKNLIEKQLDKRDRKIYFIPAGLAPREVFSLCKEAIEGRDIQHVRDVVIDQRPFEAIAWYYGQTKKTKENIVIAGIVREETNSIELFVATKDKQKLTWLLAELGRNLNEKLKEKGIVQIQQVNVSIKDSIIQRSELSFGVNGNAKEDFRERITQRTNIEEDQKPFLICPYCGKDLNLPKSPRFCPYCKEQLS